jgi:hypothetical protein
MGQSAIAFNSDSKDDAVKKGIYIDRTETDKVVCDGGSIVRTAQANAPVHMQFDTHAHNAISRNFGLASISEAKPKEINSDRIRGEIEIMLAKIISNSFFFIKVNTGTQAIDDNQAWVPALNQKFQDKLKGFEAHINRLLRSLPEGTSFSSGEQPKIHIEVQFKGNALPEISFDFAGSTTFVDMERIKKIYAESFPTSSSD